MNLNYFTLGLVREKHQYEPSIDLSWWQQTFWWGKLFKKIGVKWISVKIRVPDENYGGSKMGRSVSTIQK